MVTEALVSRADRRAERDPLSGILTGATPRDLGPQDAECAVLLVHGFGGAGTDFADLPERLAQAGIHVRLPLLPGHGTSPRDMRNATADDLLRAVLGEVEALKQNHDKVVIGGHSMGAALCTLAAAETDVDGLILGAPYFGITYRWYYVFPPDWWIKLVSPAMRWVYKGKLFIQVNRKEAKSEIVSYTWLPVSAARVLLDVGHRANEEAVLSRITCPVILIHGHGDAAASPEAARQAFEELASSNKRAVWLSRSNHHVFWDYDQEEVMGETLAFVQRVAARSMDSTPTRPQTVQGE